eukprot:TRINITY_DN1930_c0_g1_i1.p1 TRINITY_DN1930_c0_g1~~TRINITY_DN1930_c0_g1_i1.p1  ORF type:complete len:235 (+),score=38.58 TRINITY_DN1930_c0_g1_i1:76-705(+)
MHLIAIDLCKQCRGMEVENRPYEALELRVLVADRLGYNADDIELQHEGRVWGIYVLGEDDEVVVKERDPWERLKLAGIDLTEDNLKKAIAKNDLLLVKLLCSTGALKKSRKPAVWTPLHYACRKGSLPIVSAILDSGFTDINDPNSYGATPLHTAIKHSSGNIPLLAFLISRGATLQSKDALRHTPMYYAVQNGCLHAVKLLKDSGATL